MIAWAWLPASAAAQPEKRQQDEPIEVTVEGPRRAQSPGEVTRERPLLEAAPHRTASDLLRTVPGVFVTQHSGEGKAHQLFFRGFDAVHGQDLEISVAGAPVNEVSNVHGQGYADLHFVMPEVVSRLEALPGAFDPSQGDFAIAGSMRFFLGYPEPGFTVRGSYGSFDTRRLFLAYHPEGQPEQTFAAFEKYATRGFGPARQAERTSGIAQALIPIGRRLSLRVMGSLYDGRFRSAGVLPQAAVESGRLDRFASLDPEQGGRSTRGQLVAELLYRHAGWQASFAPFAVRRALRLRYNFTGFFADPEHGDHTLQRNDAATVGATARLDKRLELLSPYDAVGGGLYLRHDAIEQSQAPTRGPGPALVDAGIHATDVGGWVEASLRPLPRLRVRGGARVDGLLFAVDDRRVTPPSDAQRASGGVVAGPRASLDVALLPGLHALAAYGMGFRSPQARSLADGERTPFTRSHDFEAGLRYRDRQGVHASAAAFATLLDDDLVFNEATSRNEAAPGTLRLGAAVDLGIARGDWLVAALGASYTRATFRESNERFAAGDLLPFVPQLVGRLDGAFTPVLTQVAERDLRLAAGYALGYLFRRPLPYGELGDDVLLADARAGLRLGEAELSLEVTNLLGARWYDGMFVYASSFPAASASRVPQPHVSAGAPRTLMGVFTLYR